VTTAPFPDAKPEIPEFVQTARAQIEELDRWEQVAEQEARVA